MTKKYTINQLLRKKIIESDKIDHTHIDIEKEIRRFKKFIKDAHCKIQIEGEEIYILAIGDLLDDVKKEGTIGGNFALNKKKELECRLYNKQ